MAIKKGELIGPGIDWACNLKFLAQFTKPTDLGGGKAITPYGKLLNIQIFKLSYIHPVNKFRCEIQESLFVKVPKGLLMTTRL